MKKLLILISLLTNLLIGCNYKPESELEKKHLMIDNCIKNHLDKIGGIFGTHVDNETYKSICLECEKLNEN